VPNTRPPYPPEFRAEGSVGDGYANALAGGSFATPECEPVARGRGRTHTEARLAAFDFLAGSYHPRRRHSAPAYLSPAEYARRYRRPTAAA
jgi:transposase InsO family protein